MKNFYQQIRILFLFLFVVTFSINIQAQTSWNGSVDDDWFNGSNWSSGVPTATDAATINTTTNPPVIDAPGLVATNVQISQGGLTITANGELTLTGTLDLSNTKFFMEVDGLIAGTDRDKINVFGDAIIGGDLDLSISYAASPGDVITIFDASSSVTGSFNLVNPLPAGWTLEYDTPNPGEVSLVFPNDPCIGVSADVTPFGLDCFGYDYQLTITPFGGTAPYTVTKSLNR